MGRFVDKTGLRFGRLVVEKREAPDNRGRTRWGCACDCGGYTVVDNGNLGRTQSCGCLLGEKAKERAVSSGKPATAFGVRLSEYKNNARLRGFRWMLTDDQAIDLFLGDCHYCGAESLEVPKAGDPWVRRNTNGIDRVDNDEGYEVWNCLSCCKACNKAKGKMSYDEWISLCFSVADHMRETRGLRLVKK